MAEGRKSRAVMTLRDMVLDGTLPAGERLYEVPLSERLGISRTPLREALSQLEYEGLLERQNTGGYAVRAFMIEDVIDAIELRGVMEGTAARLCAERGLDAATLGRFRQVLSGLDAATEAECLDFEAYQQLNAEFHRLLASPPGSAVLRGEVARASRLPFASPSAFLRGQEDQPAFRRSLFGAQAQHHAIIEAIEAREGARAEAVAREHARLARRNLQYMLDQDRSIMNRVPGLALVVT